MIDTQDWISLWEERFMNSFGYLPKLYPCCQADSGEDDPECIKEVEDDKIDFINFILEEM